MLLRMKMLLRKNNLLTIIMLSQTLFLAPFEINS